MTSSDGRSLRWKAHREERRNALIRAAVRAIEQHGMHVRMEEIAAEAQIPRPLLYRYFGDAAAIQQAVVDWCRHDMVSQLIDSMQHISTSRTVIDIAADGYFCWIAAHPHLSRYAFRYTEPHLIMELRQQMAQQIVAFVLPNRPADCDSVDLTFALGVAGFVEAYALWWLDQENPPPIEPISTRVAQHVALLFQQHIGFHP